MTISTTATSDYLSLETPLSDETLLSLRAGQMLFLSGDIYTARDAAHQRMVEQIRKGEPPPFDFPGAVVFYAGPSPSPPGKVIGSIGPTTSGRMDLFAPELIRKGLKAMIGKGQRSPEVVEAMKECGGVYFAAIGGAAALLSRCITELEIIAYDDLGTEAVRRLKLERMPLIVAIDSQGGNIYCR